MLLNEPFVADRRKWLFIYSSTSTLVCTLFVLVEVLHEDRIILPGIAKISGPGWGPVIESRTFERHWWIAIGRIAES
jgi:hypothetical protein